MYYSLSKNYFSNPNVCARFRKYVVNYQQGRVTDSLSYSFYWFLYAIVENTIVLGKYLQSQYVHTTDIATITVQNYISRTTIR